MHFRRDARSKAATTRPLRTEKRAADPTHKSKTHRSVLALCGETAWAHAVPKTPK
jgi:hypothetical protein